MLKLQKRFNDAALKWEKEKDLPDFTLGFIASTLVSKGVDNFKKLSQEELEKVIKDKYDQQKDGKVLFVTPELNELILRSCKEISKLDTGIANTIIKKKFSIGGEKHV